MTPIPSHPRPLDVRVLGGLGKSGRRVAQRLDAAGHRTRVLSRSTAPRFDWTDPSTLPIALDGADAAYLAYHPDVSFPGAAAAVRRVAETAADRGVERLVLLSGRGEPDAEPAERALRTVATEAGPSWTVVRCAWFMQNFSEHFLLDGVMAGTIALPAGAVREPFVDLEDVADVVVRALTEPGHGGLTYDLTGPELLDFSEAARCLEDAVGRPVHYVDVAPEAYAESARAAGVPEEEVGPLTDLFSRVLDGHNAVLTPDLSAVLGRRGGTFADFARRTAASGVWGPSPREPRMAAVG